MQGKEKNPPKQKKWILIMFSKWILLLFMSRLCIYVFLSSCHGYANPPQQKQTLARLQSCLLFIGQAAFNSLPPPPPNHPTTAPPAAFFLKDNKESSFSDKLNINQDCLFFISYAFERKCDTNTTWGGGSKLQGTPVSGGGALIVFLSSCFSGGFLAASSAF